MDETNKTLKGNKVFQMWFCLNPGISLFRINLWNPWIYKLECKYSYALTPERQCRRSGFISDFLGSHAQT